MGYALKFMRILNLILTAIFGLAGYVAGILIFLLSLSCNKTVSHTSYLYPLLPFDWTKLKNRLIRRRLPGSLQKRERKGT